MSKSTNTPLFGTNIDPSAADPQEPFRRASVADEHGLDIITLMDHPYLGHLFDTWTLMTALAMQTERVRLSTNVANLPLRPPAMLAKMVASLDVLSGGRVELGLGAGAMWDGITAFGGPKRSPGEAYTAFKDALHILRGMWDNAGDSFSYDGEIYQVRGARPGPAPVHHIPIWGGATGPRMLRLIGRVADGIMVSTFKVTPERLLEINELIDEGAQAADRSPTDIRRCYNMMGVLDLGRPDTKADEQRPNNIYGSVQHWIDTIVDLRHNYRQDTFIFWPVAGNEGLQIEAFAKEVVPAVKEALS